jgi:large subunit ribosomal protein L29
MTTLKEIRDQTDEQLNILIEDLDKEVFELRNEFAMNKKIEKSHLIREKKKTKARALTILSERKKIVEKQGS